MCLCRKGIGYLNAWIHGVPAGIELKDLLEMVLHYWEKVHLFETVIITKVEQKACLYHMYSEFLVVSALMPPPPNVTSHSQQSTNTWVRY
jgi:hypothetical protein